MRTQDIHVKDNIFVDPDGIVFEYNNDNHDTFKVIAEINSDQGMKEFLMIINGEVRWHLVDENYP